MRTLLSFLGPMRGPVVVFCAVLMLGAAAFGVSKKGSAQSSKGSGAASGSTTAPQGNASAANPEGFAIESEMLTYTALDSEGTALACGIGRNVGAADAGCNPQAITGPPVGVVVVSGDSSALSEFQLWRTDISTMDMLTLRANHYCAQGAATRAATTLGGTILSMFPESQVAEFAASLLSATAETSPLEGNILDRTLVDDVAGHLRALGVDVVIPDNYMPYSLTAIDANHSPFLTKYVALIKARECVAPKGNAGAAPAAEPGAAGTGEADAHAEADKKAITDAIDAFLKSLTEPDVFDVPKPPPGAPPVAQAPVISHLNAVLRADGLAQELDAASPDARSGANGIWYVLSLTALESGGTLLKSGNAITGTKTSYSGGAVGTYSLFHLNGNVACSGVFFNYEPPTLTSKIPDLLKTPDQAGGKLVGGCH
ncbi:MAG: hypothetical protein ABSE53_03315 [Terracidiphilus sp.]|jgi:hypothetical protein